MSKCSQPCWPTHVLAKASVNMSLTMRLMRIRSVDGIAYWEMILSVKCPPRTVVRGDVANFFHAKILGLYVKRCDLRIFVRDRQRNSRSTKICTLIPIAIRWSPSRM